MSHTVVRALPLVRWASRFREGTVELTGHLREPCRVDVAGREVAFPAGLVSARLDFLGGPPPALLAAAVDAPGLVLDEVAGATLASAGGTCTLDGLPVPDLAMDLLLDALLDHLHDLSAEVAAWPDRDLVVKLSGGVEASVRAGDVVTVRGVTAGAPHGPLLDAPLTVTVGGAGLKVSHEKLRWLAALAQVRIQEASLHPDGKVDLQGEARGGLHRVGGGLQRVSERLSEVVRDSPRFARIRAFLRTGRG